MLLSGVLLIVLAAVALVAGIVAGVLELVSLAIVVCLAAAVVLAIGVARARPSRHRPSAVRWSGAKKGPEPPA